MKRYRILEESINESGHRELHWVNCKGWWCDCLLDSHRDGSDDAAKCVERAKRFKRKWPQYHYSVVDDFDNRALIFDI